MTIETTLDRIHNLVKNRKDLFKNDESIKASLVMPFLSALGHDPFNPDHVLAGYETEAGRADFATFDDDGAPKMLLCVSSSPDRLDSEEAGKMTALLADEGEIGVLTDGHNYRFHGVTPSRQIMEEPFMSFDLLYGTVESNILQPLTREGYDLQEAVEAGRLTKLPDAFEILIESLKEGTEFFDLLANQIAPGGVANASSRKAVSEAFDRAVSMLKGEYVQPAATEDVVAAAIQPSEEDGRVMTGDERAAYLQVCEIAGKYIDPSRIYARPAQTYLAVILDDNNRRTICRLYFLASSSRYVGTFVAKAESKHKISSYIDVQNYEAEIRERLRELDEGAFALRAAELKGQAADENPADEVNTESVNSSNDEDESEDIHAAQQSEESMEESAPEPEAYDPVEGDSEVEENEDHAAPEQPQHEEVTDRSALVRELFSSPEADEESSEEEEEEEDENEKSESSENHRPHNPFAQFEDEENDDVPF